MKKLTVDEEVDGSREDGFLTMYNCKTATNRKAEKGKDTMNKTKHLIALGVCMTMVAALAAANGHGAPGGQGTPGGNRAPNQNGATNVGGGHRQKPVQTGAPNAAGGYRQQPQRKAEPRREARQAAHHHPAGARHWARPACPPPRPGALRAWAWVATAWNMTVNGVYYYGDGYYFDGCNYYYNGSYYTTPPVVVAAPAATTIVTPPAVVTQPVVVPAAPAPQPPPPPRRRGVMSFLFGD